MQKISSIHQIILKIKQILEAQDLQDLSNIWPCASKVAFSFSDNVYMQKNQLIWSIHSWDTADYIAPQPKKPHPYLAMPTQ